MNLHERFLRRGIRRIAYFHCDHWEPWRPIRGEAAVSQRAVDEVGAFVRQLERIDFARRLTLFYKPQIGWTNDEPVALKLGLRGHAEDRVRFMERSPVHKAIYASALSQIVGPTEHAIEVHIHHENIVHNTDHAKPEAAAFFARDDVRVHEEARLEMFIQLSLAAIREETGLDLKRWFFVHGQWALNASDPKVCHVTREIEILLANGCRGDFTMPAGRGSVNPRLAVPYFVRPYDAPKGYDLPHAEPEFAYGNAQAAKDKFFIWSSRIKHSGCSLDYYAPWLRKRLESPDDFAHDIVADSFCVDGTLFIKTHAHSLHTNYYQDGIEPIAPHAQPQIISVFRRIFDTAASAGIEVQFATAAEIFDMFAAASYVPPDGFDLHIPGTCDTIDGIVPPPSSRAPLSRAVRVKATRAPIVPAKEAASLRTTAADVSIIAARIDQMCVAAVSARVEAFGLDEAGAGPYYGARLKQGRVLAGYEIDLAREILAHFGDFGSYVEVGCGFGALTILLSACGLPSVGVEPNARRLSGARDIWDTHVSGTDLARREPEWRHTTLRGFAGDTDLDQSMGLFTNIITTIDNRDRFLDDTTRFKTVIIDVQRYLSRVTTREGEDALITELCSTGLSEPREVLDLGKHGRYVAFQGSASATTRGS